MLSPAPGTPGTQAPGETLVILPHIAGIRAGIQEIDAHIEGSAVFFAPFPALAGIDQLGGHVRLETRPEIVSALDTLHLDKATGQVSVLHGGNAAHHVDAFNVFRADGAHIGSQVHVIGPQFAPGRRILQVGVVVQGLSVNGELGSQGRCGIVGRQGTGSPQVDDLGGSQHRIGGSAAGQQFQNVGNAGRLDVRNGVGPDFGGRCEAVVLLGGYHHFLKGKDIRLQLVDRGSKRPRLKRLVAQAGDGKFPILRHF